jgi:hypothetical protein
MNHKLTDWDDDDPSELDHSTAERLLDGEISPADVPPGYEDAAKLIAVIRSGLEPSEPLWEPPVVIAIVDAVDRRNADASVQTGRHPGRRQRRKRRVVAGAAAWLLLSGGTAAASVTGSLPAAIQDVLDRVSSSLGISSKATLPHNTTAPISAGAPWVGVRTGGGVPLAASRTGECGGGQPGTMTVNVDLAGSSCRGATFAALASSLVVGVPGPGPHSVDNSTDAHPHGDHGTPNSQSPDGSSAGTSSNANSERRSNVSRSVSISKKLPGRTVTGDSSKIIDPTGSKGNGSHDGTEMKSGHTAVPVPRPATARSPAVEGRSSKRTSG